MKKYVYVVSEGERGEGFTTLSVWATLPLAKRFVLWEWPYSKVVPQGMHAWEGPKDETNSVDRVRIECFEVIYQMPSTVCVCEHKKDKHNLSIGPHKGLCAACVCTVFRGQE